MEARLASRLHGVSESATLRLNAAVQAMKAKGEDVVNLTAGEPDFAVPDVAKEAMMQAVRENRSKYTPVGGIPELRSAIADKTNRQQPTLAEKNPWKGTDVVVSNGGKQALFNVFLSTLNPGDEVLIPAPYWLSYPEITKLCGALPVILPTKREDDYLLSPEALARAITTRTKILVLNSPSNPTGATYSREQFRALGEVLLSAHANQGIWVVSDEIYDRITFGEPGFTSFLEAVPELRDSAVTVNGMSKSAAMTGWRLGWSVAIPPLTASILTLQGQSTSGVNAPTQWASLAFLREPAEKFAEWKSAYERRRKLMLEILTRSGKLEVFPPKGAFYAFVGVEKAKRLGEDSMTFCERLLQEARVAAVPGGVFGEDGSIRISFATDDATLAEGCERLVRFAEGSRKN